MANQTTRMVPRIRFKAYSEPWVEEKIGDVLAEKRRPIELEDNQRYELITVKRRNEGVVSRGHLLGREILVKNYAQLIAGDFVISKRQVVHGATGIIPAELGGAIVSNEYLTAVDSRKLLTEFLAIIARLPAMRRKFFLSSYGVDIEKLLFDAEDWKRRKVTIPGVTEQTKICAHSRRLDQLIRLYQCKHKKLIALKESMLQKMFPKPGATIPEIRFKGFSENWTDKKLGDVCGPFEYGLNAPAKDYDGRNKYIRITDIDENLRNLSQANLTTPDADLVSASKYLLSEGDILFARTGASVGKTYRYQESDGRVFFAGFLIRAKAFNKECVDFIFYTTLTSQYGKFVAINSQRSGQPGINAGEYSEFSFRAPTVPEQKKIGSYFRTLDELIFQHATQIQRFQQVKFAFLEEMFV
ncbi:restriction endonuclease subunit S [Pseudomonas sp. IAC-BECa141]|uniref:restriction endonuclease subunit S n=1 Tax=Pseudomonas sp. IAC-BECa141 TaxID=2793103 RepID=UPI001D061F98|nr:restriction endonuclease subunit S [Pseudomonas sp. IAC-BECa141]UDI93681.1 restriction endonuclease subunit S [Pseudomonas sp. IAC-BECa141]